LAVASRDYTQCGAKTCLVAKQDKYIGVQNTVSLKEFNLLTRSCCARISHLNRSYTQ